MIVTVSRSYGAAGNAVVRRAAELLGYRVVDEELEVVVASRLGMPADVVESVGRNPKRFSERVLEELGGGVPETAQPALSFDDQLDVERRRGIERAVREIAEQGENVMIIGRAAGAILAGRSDLVRVFLKAPLAWRIASIVRQFGVSEDVARAEIARIDEARRAYAREGYRVAWGDPANYDLVIDTARFGVEGAANVLVAAVRAAGG